MGYDASAYLIYGVIVEEDEIVEHQQVRGCSHKATEHPHCPTCGAPTREVKKVLPEWWEEYDEPDNITMLPLDDGGWKRIMGCCLAECSSDKYVDLARTPSAQTEIDTVETLRNLGLTGKPQTWLVFHESY